MAERTKQPARKVVIAVALVLSALEVIVRAVDEIRTAITTFSQNIVELNSNLTDHVIDLERRVGRLEKNDKN